MKNFMIAILMMVSVNSMAASYSDSYTTYSMCKITYKEVGNKDLTAKFSTKASRIYEKAKFNVMNPGSWADSKVRDSRSWASKLDLDTRVTSCDRLVEGGTEVIDGVVEVLEKSISDKESEEKSLAEKALQLKKAADLKEALRLEETLIGMEGEVETLGVEVKSLKADMDSKHVKRTDSLQYYTGVKVVQFIDKGDYGAYLGDEFFILTAFEDHNIDDTGYYKGWMAKIGTRRITMENGFKRTVAVMGLGNDPMPSYREDNKHSGYYDAKEKFSEAKSELYDLKEKVRKTEKEIDRLIVG